MSDKSTSPPFDITGLDGLNNDQWLRNAMRVADIHPEFIQALKEQAYRRFSGYQLEPVLHKLDQVAAIPGLERLYEMTRLFKNSNETSVKITKNIAEATVLEECHKLIRLRLILNLRGLQ